MQANRKIIGPLVLVACVACLSPGAISAQGLGNGLRFATPGIGLELEPVVTERFGLRGWVNGGALPYDYDEPGIRYDGRLRPATGFLLADWHPYASGFRLTGGLAYSNQRLGGTAGPSGATINISWISYSSVPAGSLDGRIAFSKATPYLGVGWGLRPRANSRLYFSADLGLMYQRPSAALAGQCGIALPMSVCSQLHSDLRAEEAEVRDIHDDVRLYPVISVGFGLRF